MKEKFYALCLEFPTERHMGAFLNTVGKKYNFDIEPNNTVMIGFLNEKKAHNLQSSLIKAMGSVVKSRIEERYIDVST